MSRLAGRVAIVTGAAQGIGRAIALGMAREGAHVVLADLQMEKSVAVAAEIERADGVALALATDVRAEDSVAAMVARSLEHFGRIDVLANVAGIAPASLVEAMAEEEWDRVIDTNLVGTFLCCRAVVPELMRRRAGRIINTSSGIAFRGARGEAHYAATKAGIIGLTKALALELAPYGVTVNAICPGLTDTSLSRESWTEEQMASRAAQTPLGRIGRPEDLVGPALFLASDAAGFVTGQVLPINGGSTMV